MVTTLGELLSGDKGLIQTGPFGSQLKQNEYSEEGIPVVMPTNIKEGKIVIDGIAYISEEKAQVLNRHKLKIDSILLPRRGEISKRAFISEKEMGWICGTGCIKIEINRSDIIPKYLYYLMGTSESVGWLINNAVGTTMLNLSASILQRFPVSLPPFETQKTTVNILSKYDDLIENNRRRIALLEESARLLYREWFVHLHSPENDDVKIKEGVPEGWELQTLGELVVINKGRNITKDTVVDGTVPVVAGGLKPAYYHNTSNTKGPVVTVSASGANAGYVGVYLEDIWASDCSYLSASDNDHIWFWYSFLKSRQTEITAMQQGTAQPHVYPKQLRRIQFALPPKSLMDLFNDLAEPLFTQKKYLEEMNRNLTKARDLLLPRLMDGRISV